MHDAPARSRASLSSAPPSRRIRPMMIAPLIPIWGLLGFLGVEHLGGTHWFAPFLLLMGGLFVLLFGFVARQAISARRLRRATRKLGD